MNDKNQIGRLSRRDFIFSPYLVCPNCNRSNSFGVLMVLTDRYVRECRECSYRIEYSLPRLNKKIIYLDQFVISEMMKEINGSLGKTEKVDDFWLTLFEKLNVLIRLQLIICPSSFFHV